jgi:ABC-type nitrate/sulfonate/bicarbonate transport system permease component
VKTSVKTAASVLPYLWAAIFIVFVWQMVVVFTQAHVALLPPPLLAAKTFAELVVNGQLFVHAGASLGRVVSAWLLSAAIAIPLGLAMGRWRRFEHLVDPVIELFRPISPLAWIPLAFFPILLNTVSGVKGVDPVLIRAGQVLGCDNDRALFRKVILPAAMPTIVVGLRISFGTGWAAIIAAELVAAQVGLGYLIADGMEVLRSDLVLVGMVAIGILGVLIDAVFRTVNDRFSWGT